MYCLFFSFADCFGMQDLNFIKDVGVPLISAGIGGAIGGYFALRATKKSIDASAKQLREEFELERNLKNKTSIESLKIEIQENLKALEGVNDEIKNYIEGKSTKKVYIRLSDMAWNNCRHLISHFDEKVSSILCNAYVAVGKINTCADALLSHGNAVYTVLSESIEKAESLLKKAQEILSK